MTKTNRKFQTAAFQLAETAVFSGILILSLMTSVAHAQTGPVLPFPPLAVSTVPSNGDVNPYGVAFVPRIPSDGIIQTNDILVSNFNNSQNLQGTGTTIVRVTPAGQASLFFQSKAAGLTAALGVLPDGIVIVGNLPTTDGTSGTIQPGSLQVIDRHGQLLGAIASPQIAGPWGMAIHDGRDGSAQIFVSDVLAGTVLRLDVTYSANGESLTVRSIETIAAGFNHRTDPAALVLGPTGLLYDPFADTLFVASSADNAVYTLTGAAAATSSLGSGTLLFQDLTHLHGPLDIAQAPNGDLLIANSDGSNADPNQPSELTEFNFAGKFVAEYPVDPNNGGAFGLKVMRIGTAALRVAAVDDNQNSLFMWTTVMR
jgi:hypothetical protein